MSQVPYERAGFGQSDSLMSLVTRLLSHHQLVHAPWAARSTEALLATTTAALTRGTSVTLDIPLDEPPVTHPPARSIPATTETPSPRAIHIKRPDSRPRDSLARREALFKGREGSRRRQRWENDRLLHNPHAQPPLPSDWEVRPTYPVHAVPYYLAPLWEGGLAARSAAKTEAQEKERKASAEGEHGQSGVPRELREKLKRARAAKGLLQDLEQTVRAFVAGWEEKRVRERRRREDEGLEDVHESDEDEVVFVGRNGAMSDMRGSRGGADRSGDGDADGVEQTADHRLVFESLESDHGASFGRWLVHNIATYYNLRTWSVTTGEPARREAYVGIKQHPSRDCGRELESQTQLPHPLWALV